MIEVNQLCKTYGSQTAVENISFSISAGEVVGLIGHNGSGKTTTMRMLTGCLQPSSGDVFFKRPIHLRASGAEKKGGLSARDPAALSGDDRG